MPCTVLMYYVILYLMQCTFNISLNIVKRRVQYWLSNGILNKDEFGERLKQMPWSKGTFKVHVVCFVVVVVFFFPVLQLEKSSELPRESNSAVVS